MSFSNDEVAILAIVDWSIEENGSITYDKVLYAAHCSGDNFFASSGTLGGNNNKINKAILKHVVDRSLPIFCNYDEEHLAEFIYDKPSAALAILTGNVDSSGMFVNGIYLMGSNSPTFFEKIMNFRKIDWKNRP